MLIKLDVIQILSMSKGLPVAWGVCWREHNLVPPLPVSLAMRIQTEREIFFFKFRVEEFPAVLT